MITVKEYYCPACGNQEKHSTNHIGEIYCHCKACGNSPLYCVEGKAQMESRPQAKATLVCYRFNVESESEREAYHNLKRELRDKGYKAFESYQVSPAGHRHLFSFAAFRSHNGEQVTLYDPTQFSNQYVSNIGRVFQWYAAVYPNNKIKEGYYLQIEEA